MAAPRREQDPYEREDTDLSSARFNPLAALYSPHVSVPYPDIELYDNLAQYESVINTRNGRQATPANAPSSAGDGTGSAVVGVSRQTFDYGHGSSDATYATREIPPRPHSSSGYHESIDSVTGHLRPQQEDFRRDSHRDYGTRDPYLHHREPHAALGHPDQIGHPESDPYCSGRDPYRAYPDRDPHRAYPDRDPHREYPDRDPHRSYPDQDPHRSYPDRDPHREYPDRDPHRAYSDQDLHREYPDQDPYKQYLSSPRDRHSHSSAYVRDPEYLERKGLLEEDCKSYDISRRNPKPQPSCDPKHLPSHDPKPSSSRDSQMQTKLEIGKKGAESKFTKVVGSVGGARGAWSYDKVKETISTETVIKREDNALPESFETQTTCVPAEDYTDQTRNVFTRMEEYSNSNSGPLHILYRCMKEKLQARVWTRSAVSVRGICKGYIVAFDKHANLAMIDVDEYYRNPAMKGVRLKSKKKLAEKIPAGQVAPPLPCEATWLGLRQEKLAQRHLNQVFIRGDNVVSVSIVQDWS
ncbi:uncharacterized protein LOC121379722 [Gigantopelta aegis]|uniref:uncharacterized protein LOC121379722 n=1 Tax=Gigantopelta aegis TaxID=1735272 RepID=UPI001B888B68|nr:uncharacterized protein LOC121379722 [Gigantopelta aegis]